MGTISLQIPLSGQPNSTEDPKIASDFTTVQTVINGNIDTNNVSPTAGITATQLAASAQFGGSVQLTFAAPARAYRNAAYGTFSGGAGYYTLAADTKSFDPGTNFSTGTGLYTCPAAGYYQVNGQVRFVGSSSGLIVGVSIYKNGAIYAEGNVPASYTASSPACTVSDVVQCAANDTLAIYFYYPGAGVTTLGVGTSVDNYISVVRVA